MPVEPHRPLLVVAAGLLGLALQRNNGFYTPEAIAIVVAALTLAWASVLAPAALARFVPDRDGIVTSVLVAVVLAQLAAIERSPIGMYFARPMPAQHPGFVPGLWVVAASAVVAAVGSRPWRTAAAVGVVVSAGVLGWLTYQGSPHPAIDVVTVHHEAFATMARGASPYSLTFPDIYEGRQAFYPPGMVVDGRVQYGFPYPPLGLLMTWPGHLAGDFRLAELAWWLVGAAAAVAAGRRSAIAVLAMALLLFTPRAFFALEQAWTEPLSVAWLGLGLWAASRRRLVLAAVLVGLAAATKQYLVVALPLTFLLDDVQRRDRWRLPLVAAASAGLAVLPGLLIDPAGFMQSAVMVQVRESLRMDALSLAVSYAQVTGSPIPGAIYGLVVAAATAVSAWRAPRTAAGFAAALAVTLFTTFSFGKKAFCNYYVFVIAAVAMAIATASPALTPARRRAAAAAPTRD